MSSEYIDQIYHYQGAWDVPSFCGLKTIRRKDAAIIVLTDLYDSNPGTSVTQWIDKLATEIIHRFNFDPKNSMVIVQNPDRKSNLVFLKETFDVVTFEWDGTRFLNPVWKRISTEEAARILS